MKISIITVVKNNKAGLLRAIECVRNQSYKNVEHIIVDGGSTDGTKGMMDDGRWMMDNVKFFSEPDEGIYDAINKGIRLATGEIIGLLHSDDLYANENVLEQYVSAFNQLTTNHQQPTINAVYSDLVYVSQKPGGRSKASGGGDSTTSYYQLPTTTHQLSTSYSIIRYWKTQNEEFTTEAQRHRELQKGWMPPHPTLFVRKEIFEKYGLYRTDMKIAADYEMILRLLYKNNITSYYLPITTYLMTIGGASNKSLGNIFQKSKEDFRAMKINGINFPSFTLAIKNIRKLPQFLARDLS